MSRDGSGTYTLPTNSFAEPVAGTVISPTDAATTLDDIATEMTDSLSRSGKGSMSADLDMNNNDINNTKTVVMKGSTSGNTTVQATAIAGTTTITLPAATDTLVGKATTDTLTNKTISGATNSVALSAIAAQAGYSFVGNNTGSSAAPTAVDIAALTTKASPAAGDYVILSDQAASGAWKKATVSSVGSAGSVSSIAGNTGAFTLGYGLTNSTNDIRASLTTANNSLSGNVSFTNTASYANGPSMAQGTSGTWFASGTVTITGGGTGDDIFIKLWDGTTVISSASLTIPTANYKASVSLSGVLASPAGNIRIDCRNSTSNTGTITFNATGNSKDSTVSGVRIAP